MLIHTSSISILFSEKLILFSYAVNWGGDNKRMKGTYINYTYIKIFCFMFWYINVNRCQFFTHIRSYLYKWYHNCSIVIKVYCQLIDSDQTYFKETCLSLPIHTFHYLFTPFITYSHLSFVGILFTTRLYYQRKNPPKTYCSSYESIVWDESIK